MHIVTHGMIGFIGAAALGQWSPAAGLAFAVGNVAPDLDIVVRCFGARRYLAFHRTWTHAVPLLLLLIALLLPGAALLTPTAWWWPLALLAGLLLHVLLDATNDAGVALWLPFSTRRHQGGQIFFVDLVVLVAGLVACAAVLGIRGTRPDLLPELGFAAGLFLLGYWAWRCSLRRRAARTARALPGEVESIVPHPVLPWRFLVIRRDGADMEAGRLDLRDKSGVMQAVGRWPCLDEHYADLLEATREWRCMRAIGPCYHVVEAERRDGHLHLTCRDLRYADVVAGYGQLELVLGADGIRVESFRV